MHTYATLRTRLAALVAGRDRGAATEVSAYWRQHLAQFDADDPLRRRRSGATSFPGLASYSRAPVPRAVFTLANVILAPRGHRRIFRSAAYRAVRSVTARQRRHLDFDAIKHAHILDMLERQVAPRAATVCVIGDGLANFVAPALELTESYARVISINLPEVLLTDSHLLEEAGVGASCIRLVTDAEQIASAVDDPDVRLILVSASAAEIVRGVRVDGFVNISSMQEMTHSVIGEYFTTIRASGGWFYCCNKVSKRLPDGTIVRFDEFPWGSPRWIVGPEQCPWYRRAFSARPPFVTRFSPTTHALLTWGK